MTVADHAGRWAGINEFRLMPSDPFHEAPAAANVSIGAAGHVTSIGYTWSHPEDGEQSGLLVLGTADEPGSVLALWVDSWHQSPAAKVLLGAIEDGLSIVGYEYGGGWKWRVTVEATSDLLRIRMDNVIPESEASEDVPAGAYAAMVTTLHRVV